VVQTVPEGCATWSGAPACGAKRGGTWHRLVGGGCWWRSSGGGSRPKLQWGLQTRMKAWSRVPCIKQWLQCGTPPQT